MALTSAQRNKLPPSAFVIHSGPRSNWAYPIPTKSQAAKAGISETQRQNMMNAAKAYAARGDTRSSTRTVRATVNKRK